MDKNNMKTIVEMFLKEDTYTLPQLCEKYGVLESDFYNYLYGRKFKIDFSLDPSKIKWENVKRKQKQIEQHIFQRFLTTNITFGDLVKEQKCSVEEIITLLEKNCPFHELFQIQVKRLRTRDDFLLYFEFIANDFTFFELGQIHHCDELAIVSFFDSCKMESEFTKDDIQALFRLNHKREKRHQEIIKQTEVNESLLELLKEKRELLSHYMTKEIYVIDDNCDATLQSIFGEYQKRKIQNKDIYYKEKLNLAISILKTVELILQPIWISPEELEEQGISPSKLDSYLHYQWVKNMFEAELVSKAFKRLTLYPKVKKQRHKKKEKFTEQFLKLFQKKPFTFEEIAYIYDITPLEIQLYLENKYQKKELSREELSIILKEQQQREAWKQGLLMQLEQSTYFKIEYNFPNKRVEQYHKILSFLSYYLCHLEYRLCDVGEAFNIASSRTYYRYLHHPIISEIFGQDMVKLISHITEVKKMRGHYQGAETYVEAGIHLGKEKRHHRYC